MPVKSRKYGRRKSLGKNRKHKKTMRMRAKKNRKRMIGGNPPSTPVQDKVVEQPTIQPIYKGSNTDPPPGNLNEEFEAE